MSMASYPSLYQSLGVSHVQDIKLLLKTFYSGFDSQLTEEEKLKIDKLSTRVVCRLPSHYDGTFM